MTCEKALLLISGHLDNANTAEEEEHLQRHLASCPACRDLLLTLQQQDFAVSQLQEDAPQTLYANVMQVIRRESGGKRKRRHAWYGAAAAAAVAAVVISVGALRAPQLQTEQTAAQLTRSTEPTAMAVEEVVSAQPKIAAYSAADQVSGSPAQQVADERRADVAVFYGAVPQAVQNCPQQMLEDGTVLYTLTAADTASQLAQTHGGELYSPMQPDQSCSVSYVLLLP